MIGSPALSFVWKCCCGPACAEDGKLPRLILAARVDETLEAQEKVRCAMGDE